MSLRRAWLALLPMGLGQVEESLWCPVKGGLWGAALVFPSTPSPPVSLQKAQKTAPAEAVLFRPCPRMPRTMLFSIKGRRSIRFVGITYCPSHGFWAVSERVAEKETGLLQLAGHGHALSTKAFASWKRGKSKDGDDDDDDSNDYMKDLRDLVSSIDGKIEALDHGLTTVEAKVSKLDGAMQTQHAAIWSDVSQSVTDLEGEMETAYDALKHDTTKDLEDVKQLVETSSGGLAGRIDDTTSVAQEAKGISLEMNSAVNVAKENVSIMVGQVDQVNEDLNATKGTVMATQSTAAGTMSAANFTRFAVAAVNEQLPATPSCCSPDDASTVLIISGPNSNVATFDRLGVVVAREGGKVHRRLLDTLTAKDFDGVGLTIFAPQGNSTTEEKRLLIADWYNYKKCGVMVVVAEESSVELANDILAGLAPDTKLRFGSAAFGQGCDSIDIFDGGDPFYVQTVLGVESASASEVTGEGRALLTTDRSGASAS
ncbi:unnamed protein product [Symbiodinium natans]|uniref:Uncharacterized protein n=1 Tax=Symbiodinium natans TaxID=878477 RepID=A0A812QZU9_9DINO|nr:unnamed protein product [Symbiodinium natans]